MVAGQQARSLLNGEPFLGAVDAPEFPRPYVKWSAQPARAADVPAALARGLHLATQPPYGPVFVSVPVDDWVQPGVDVRHVRRSPLRAGPGGDPAWRRRWTPPSGRRSCSGPRWTPTTPSRTVALAERTRAAVWASPMSSRCSFPEDHPLFAGFLPPADRQLRQALQAYDRVLVIGAPAFVHHVETPADGPELPPLHLVHDDPTTLSWAPAGAGLLATAPALSALLAAHRRPHWRRRGRRRRRRGSRPRRCR